ncbi:hypothetical protein [Spirillospora sp. NBC_01491]|uniref:hypothetical protein n=1 Tax=Spirillospora sp. NBC_01491 TaxID=2976007 RepID=UPI002E31D30E|nr:hypothetical protein [Spirillospora sp. NBC_01491]
MGETTLLDADARHPGAAAVGGGGVLFALGAGKGFLAHRESGGTLHTYVTLTVPEGWRSGIDFADTDGAKATLLENFAGWDPALTELINDVEGALVPRPIYALRVGHGWAGTPGVTLLATPPT